MIMTWCKSNYVQNREECMSFILLFGVVTSCDTC